MIPSIYNYIVLLLFGLIQTGFENEAPSINQKAWERHDSVLMKIKAPEFLDSIYCVKEYGAIADTIYDSRPAFIKAIEACHAKGGGKVRVPKGSYKLNGPLVLLSNVQIVMDSANIYFAANPTFYLPLVLVRWEGTVCYNYSPLIYAYRQKNISIVGTGEINGCGDAYWYKWNDLAVNWEQRLQIPERNTIRKMGNDTIPVYMRVFGNGFLDLNGDGKDDGYGDGKPHFLRPTLFEPYECENVWIEGITFRNSPFWTIHPVFCNNVIIKNVRVLEGSTNDDGIDPDGCSNVLIDGCYINTHDDAISIKAGRDQDAWIRKGTKNIIVRNCTLSSKCNAFCIGSEMSGGVENVWFYDSKIIRTDQAINFKTNLDRGGFIRNVFVNNIDVDSTRLGIYFQMDYHGYRGNNYPTKFNDFYLSNIEMKFVENQAIKVVGVKQQPIQRVWMNAISSEAIINQIDTAFVRDLVLTNIRLEKY